MYMQQPVRSGWGSNNPTIEVKTFSFQHVSVLRTYMLVHYCKSNVPGSRKLD